MSEDPIDRILDQLKAEPIPEAPANLESRVLRTIRVSPDGNLFKETLLPVPRAMVLRYAAVVAILAMGSGLILGSAVARSAKVNPKLVAREALSFDVLHAEASYLPHNLLKK